jgi:hypothetical protein
MVFYSSFPLIRGCIELVMKLRDLLSRSGIGFSSMSHSIEGQIAISNVLLEIFLHCEVTLLRIRVHILNKNIIIMLTLLFRKQLRLLVLSHSITFSFPP